MFLDFQPQCCICLGTYNLSNYKHRVSSRKLCLGWKRKWQFHDHVHRIYPNTEAHASLSLFPSHPFPFLLFFFLFSYFSFLCLEGARINCACCSLKMSHYYNGGQRPPSSSNQPWPEWWCCLINCHGLKLVLY